MQKRFFTVKTSSTSGFGDQLGTQFSRLYSIGCLLGLEYCYSPLSFPRSVEPVWFNAIKKVIFFIRYYIVFSRVDYPIFKIISRILERGEAYINRLNSKMADETLSKFIGFPNNNKNKGNPAVYYDVYIEDLINKGLITVSQIRKALNFENQTIYDEGTIIRFCWSNNTHMYIPQIDSICKDSLINSEKIANSFFNKKYWATKEAQGRPNLPSNSLVMHVRCGDSTVIDLVTRKFTINETRIVTDEELKKILIIDENRLPIEIDTYKDLFRTLTSHFNSDAFDLFIISDGFKQSYHNFLRCLLQFNNTTKLTNDEKKILKMRIKTLNSDFKQFHYFKNTQLIIGETKKNLFSSIDALADAKILIWGSGGFAYYTHTLFKRQPSLLIHARGFNDYTVNSIKQQNSIL